MYVGIHLYYPSTASFDTAKPNPEHRGVAKHVIPSHRFGPVHQSYSSVHKSESGPCSMKPWYPSRKPTTTTPGVGRTSPKHTQQPKIKIKTVPNIEFLEVYEQSSETVGAAHAQSASAESTSRVNAPPENPETQKDPSEARKL
jgi:hypothetical protein